ncbi:MAG: hypothetical protein ACREJP_09970 [Candidatus Methylomirabilales bacterium]
MPPNKQPPRAGKKDAAPRRPAKAKGALPVPRTAPKRRPQGWRHHPAVRAGGGALALAVAALVVWQVIQLRERSAEKKAAVRAVEDFERALSVLQAPISGLFQALATVPGEFKEGKMGPVDFKTATDGWLGELRKLSDGLRKEKVPAKLEDAKALLVQGIVGWIDAVKAFQIAAATNEPGVRDQALAQGKNLEYHAGILYANGQQALSEERRRLGIGPPSSPDAPEPPSLIKIPDEEAPPGAAPQVPSG